MQGFPKNQGRGGRASEAVRKQLIRREMRFVLHQDVRRFTQQLLARLFDEGCNLNPALARIRFYEDFVCWLAADLPADARGRFYEKTTDDIVDAPHRRYHAAVRYLLAHLPDAETQITATVLNVIEALKMDWQQTAIKCLSNANPEDSCLRGLVEEFSRANAEGNLAQHGFDRIRRRIRLAVITSLMRHVRKPDLLREKFGSVPQILRGVSQNPTFFSALMATFEKQIPYAAHIMAQSFWRTLNNMDTELPDADPMQAGSPAADPKKRPV
jgi:hypothetical protein